MTRITIDFESRSRCDLKKCGVWKYAEDPSTEVLCIAWSGEDDVVHSHIFDQRQLPSTEFLKLLYAVEAGAIVNAHNATFEYLMWNRVMPRFVPSAPALHPSQLRCSMARALSCGLPAGLDNLAAAMNLPVKKDTEGYRLMLKMCKPNKKGEWVDSPEGRQRLALYCRQDVTVEASAEKYLPELSESEQQLWELTLRVNERGVPLDAESCTRAALAMREYSDELNARCRELSGVGGRQVAALLAELENRGIELESLDKNSVAKALELDDIDPVARELLELRQELGRASTSKLDRMIEMKCSDDRIRGNLRYHGAATGRWSGEGVQFQNLFRSTIKDTDTVLAAIHTDLLHELYESPAEAVASAVRGMIQTPHRFIDGDYSAIEARVLAWLTDDAAYALYRQNKDTYKVMAGKIFGIDPAAVTSDQRHVGKQAELGCGYGMGHKKFYATCVQYGIDMTPKLAKHTIEVYRNTHPNIVKFWYDTENAAISATENRGQVRRVGKTAWKRDGDWLKCRLPSGRLLRYYRPHVLPVEVPWGGTKGALHYTYTEKSRGTVGHTYGGALVENITQAVARDFMAGAMVRLEAEGFPIVLTVHDEILVESSTKSEAEFVRLMEQTPPWADGFPLKVGAWVGRRYRKG